MLGHKHGRIPPTVPREPTERMERQRLDPVIKDAQLDVLEKVRSGGKLDWLERNVIEAILGNRIGMCQEVEDMVREMKEKGELIEVVSR